MTLLSPAQLEIIVAMQAGARLSCLTGIKSRHGDVYSPTLWPKHGPMRNVRRATVDALVDRGLLSQDFSDWRAVDYHLAAAGKEAKSP